MSVLIDFIRGRGSIVACLLGGCLMLCGCPGSAFFKVVNNSCGDMQVLRDGMVRMIVPPRHSVKMKANQSCVLVAPNGARYLLDEKIAMGFASPQAHATARKISGPVIPVVFIDLAGRAKLGFEIKKTGTVKEFDSQSSGYPLRLSELK